jgi:hypothetical protein
VKRTIHRVSHRKRWVTIDQRAIEDSRLPWAARGLLVYLLSKPDDWQVRVKDLQKRGDLGRDGIYRLLAVLRQFHYLSYQKNRDRDGRVRGGSYAVYEVPYPDSPETAFPDTAPPRSADSEALPNTDSYLVNNKQLLPKTNQGPTQQTQPRRQNESRVPQDVLAEIRQLTADLTVRKS